MKSASSSLRKVLLSPSFSDFDLDNGSVDMMDEDAISNFSIRVKISLTVWDFILPATPSLPAVIGVSWNHAYRKVKIMFLSLSFSLFFYCLSIVICLFHSLFCTLLNFSH